jgi:murein DD-endopeptidase MepM/ murein hydrolase activator NlpD
VARDGPEWVAVGRELLGTRPKTVAVVVRAGDEELRSSLRLRADPRNARVPTLRLAASIVAGLNDANRAREQAVLAPAYARRTPVAWTRPFALPLQGAPRVSAFGSSRRYFPGGPVNYHYGEDLVAPSGTPVRATNDGTVVVAGTRYEIRGNLVGVDHGAGVVSLYFHLSRFEVKVGQKVRRGQTVGRVGTTGVSTGPHLHWEMRVRGEATDPMQWVGKRWP